jgi:hypothetical protein
MHTPHPFSGSIFLWQDALRWKLLVGIFSSQFAITLSSHNETMCLERPRHRFQSLFTIFCKRILLEDVWALRRFLKTFFAHVRNSESLPEMKLAWEEMSIYRTFWSATSSIRHWHWMILLKWILYKECVIVWARWNGLRIKFNSGLPWTPWWSSFDFLSY